LATGLFATKAINPAGADGLFFGNPGLFWTQAIATGVTIGYSLVATAIILKVVDLAIGLRASEHDEIIGLDLSQHHEAAYTVLD
jgi:Amt family ammonium transporter